MWVKIILGAFGEIGDADCEVFARLTVTQQKVYLYTKINGCVYITHLIHKKLQLATQLLTVGLEVRLERDALMKSCLCKTGTRVFFSNQNEVSGETGPGLA